MAVAALAILTAACGSGADPAPAGTTTQQPSSEMGTGHLDMGDVTGSSVEDHLTGPAKPLTGQLAARPDGCVTVVIDGVERFPIWPDGSVVKQSGDEDHYLVALPGGVTLAADGTAGDTFEAAGIVYDESVTASATSTDPPGKAESLLAFCAIKAQPVAFPDAATFRVRQA
ncbi:hypothetical protein Aca07nite_70910 [Actinoplanes capillaceus]|uniref:Uncharacterized protein n=1 Tax=Actinoplanes campanulatus TaxID=113559 RepID=A0ABQ3WU54_9ACTN|nr:hypothetical protein Aca07nite_70910 [Actinoplanes capillaceus]